MKEYVDQLLNQKIIGATTGVSATVVKILSAEEISLIVHIPVDMMIGFCKPPT